MNMMMKKQQDLPSIDMRGLSGFEPTLWMKVAITILLAVALMGFFTAMGIAVRNLL